MMKRYKVGDNFYWYEEGCQPENAELVEKKQTKKVVAPTENAKVDVKILVPKNKAKGVKAK